MRTPSAFTCEACGKAKARCLTKAACSKKLQAAHAADKRPRVVRIKHNYAAASGDYLAKTFG